MTAASDRSPPLRLETRLVRVILLLSLLPTVLVTIMAYYQTVEALREERVRVVGRVADQRHQQLNNELRRFGVQVHEQLEALRRACGARLASDACLTRAIADSLARVGASGALLQMPGRPPLAVGDSAAVAGESLALQAGQITRFTPPAPDAERRFIIRAHDADNGAELTLTYPASLLHPLFAHHPDLGASGETFLADEQGFFITPARYPSVQGVSHPISATPMRRCLSPQNGETLDLDYRHVDIIHGFHHVPEIGGGCIMAHVDQKEAFAPLVTLRAEMVMLILVLVGLGLFVARTFARKLAAPIQALTVVTREIAGGKPDLRVAPAGYAETIDLANAFNTMADHLARQNAELEVRVRERTASLDLMAKVFTHLDEAVVITDPAVNIVTVNAAFSRLTGYAPAEVIGHDPKMLSAGRTPPEVYDDMWTALTQRGTWEGELWDRRKNGECYPKWLSIVAVRDSMGRLTNYIGTFTNIAERKATEQRILHLAHHDALTQLPNRLNLQQRFEQAASSARRHAKHMAVYLIDLDRFKTINDTLGHHIGDLLLVEVAERLRVVVRESDIVARLGGDEFVVVSADMEAAEDAGQVAKKLLESLSLPYPIDGELLRTTPSIGICRFPEDGADLGELLRNADVAMYQAKSQGRNNFQFFNAEMQVNAVRRVTLEADLRQALERDEFELHYQPQLELRTGQICGVEALLRWRHPRGGLVSPLEFIPIAEESGLIGPLGDWVLREAMRQQAEWRAAGLSLRVSVNLSASQFRDARLPGRVAELLAERQLPNDILDLEITESMSMHAPADAIAQMHALADQGVTLSVDDFGTGYSSLAYLKLFPIRTLKIDRSFVKDIETDPNDADICDVTVLLAHKLGLQVVAEGVETPGQLNYLLSIGCEMIQGYLISHPLPPDAAEAFIRAHRPMTWLGTVELWETD